MAITRQDCEVLFFSKVMLGVSFSKVLTLGRLNMYVKKEEIMELVQDYDPALKTKFGAINFDSEYTEPLFNLLGANQIDSIDFSDYEDASIIHDLNQPIPEKYHRIYSTVVDGGTIEHVFHFPNAIQNCVDALEVGGHYIGITPGNNQMGHGFYQFSPELYFRIFSPENGFRVCKLLLRVSENHYEVKDPNEVGSRIELINNQPTFLIVIAEKRENLGKLKIPQQSDYVRGWSIVKSMKSNIQRSDDSRFMHFYRRMVPLRIKIIARNLYDIIFKEKLDSKDLGVINPEHFQKIELSSKLNPSTKTD